KRLLRRAALFAGDRRHVQEGTKRPLPEWTSRPSCLIFSSETDEETVTLMSEIAMRVNGREVRAEVEDRTLLVHFLREQLRLTGTHVGCDTSQCGACVVHIDGKAVKSCTTLAVQADGCEILTIEGLADGDALHPLQAAFRTHHALQCGFCTPGMIMSALDMIRRHPDGDRKSVV